MVSFSHHSRSGLGHIKTITLFLLIQKYLPVEERLSQPSHHAHKELVLVWFAYLVLTISYTVKLGQLLSQLFDIEVSDLPLADVAEEIRLNVLTDTILGPYKL